MGRTRSRGSGVRSRVVNDSSRSRRPTRVSGAVVRFARSLRPQPDLGTQRRHEGESLRAPSMASSRASTRPRIGRRLELSDRGCRGRFCPLTDIKPATEACRDPCCPFGATYTTSCSSASSFARQTCSSGCATLTTGGASASKVHLDSGRNDAIEARVAVVRSNMYLDPGSIGPPTLLQMQDVDAHSGRNDWPASETQGASPVPASSPIASAL